MVTAVSEIGIVTQPLHLLFWSEVIGASDAPKSTVPALMSVRPLPEPPPP